MLKGRRILIGVCGSIAAYKSAYLVRLLVKAGAEVRVVMTPAATRFIGPLSFRTLTNFPVFSNLWEDQEGMELKSPHIHLAEWAEIFLIAPCTADTLSRMALGRSENALDAVFLSARCPVLLAPAMDLEMYKNKAVQENIQTLRNRGISVLDTDPGELASGLVGEGRMKEPEELLTILQDKLGVSPFWSGKKIMITAGPTREKIDPVRFLSNFSSGKMGFALAEQARNAGAEVILISGPVNISPPAGITLIRVESAEEMYQACIEWYDSMQFVFMAAAVADYTPEIVADEKIKKQEDAFSIRMKKTKDILLDLGKRKKSTQKIIGFALETQQEEEYALAKMKAKNLDMIVLNSLRTPGAGFGVDTNQVNLYRPGQEVVIVPLLPKSEVARAILSTAETL
jgi:phosphopantothenoylcysteine decarboxylase / phosphopantothenate---cysteine ligase